MKPSAVHTLADQTLVDLSKIAAIIPIDDNSFILVVDGIELRLKDNEGQQRKALSWAWSCWSTAQRGHYA